METLTLELSTLYGDHHVVEVRRILLALPGVSDVYASSAFHTVEVSYDPAVNSPENIRLALAEAGYLGEMPTPIESEIAAYQSNQVDTYFRHTEVYENVRSTVSFAQNVAYEGRPLWPCPGMGPIKTRKPEEE
jgi:copper chaperone CopZ